MKILLGTNHLIQPGGSETWTFMMAEALRRKGHQVSVLTIEHGLYALRFKVPVVQEPEDEYDLLLLNHITIVGKVADVKGFKIQTCHGVVPALEQPERWVDRHVAISEEVRTHLMSLGYSSSIIRNGVDLQRFKSVKPIGQKLKKVFCLPQSSTAQQIVKKVCDQMGLEFQWARQEYDVAALMNDADLVVSLGRGAYEAMACERAVVVFDVREYQGGRMDGMVTKENWRELARCNFSGRSLDKVITVGALREEFEKYDVAMGQTNRKIVEENFNADLAADQYLEMKNAVQSKEYYGDMGISEAAIS